MSRSELDFYDQFIWKFTEGLTEDWFYGCTRCGQLLDNYSEVQNHCTEQNCESVESVDWLKELEP